MKKTYVAVAIIVIIVMAGLSWYVLVPSLTPKENRTLRVITWGGSATDAMQTLAGQYTNQAGIQVVIQQQGAAADTLAKVQSSWPNVPGDIVTTTAVVAQQMMKSGYLAPIEPSAVTNLKYIPDVYNVKANGSVYITGLQAYVFVVTWRTDLYPHQITSFSDLFSPALRGKIGIPSPSYAGGSFLIQLALTAGGNERDIRPGIDQAKKLAPNIGLIYNSDQASVNGLTTGQVWVEYTSLQDYVAANKTGVPLKAVAQFSDTKTILQADVWVVLKGPNSDLALNFLNYMLGAQQQSYWAQFRGLIPPSTQAQPASSIIPIIKSTSDMTRYSYLPDEQIAAASVPQWVQEWNTQVQPLGGH